jgi:hypothetical protein
MDLWRKLRRFGCLGLNTSAYVLPDIPACHERLDWLAKQVQDAGGEATVSRVSLIEGITDETIISRFRSQADAQYASLLKGLRNATKKTERSARAREAALRKFRRWFNEIRDADYFEADHRHDADAAIAGWEQSLRGESLKALPVLKPDDFQKRTWVTRPRPEIDRCASAWLIRRFVDRSAKFLFASKRTARPKVITFDMLEGDFTHEGDRCTFETLCQRFGVKQKPILELAQMIHDADLEDSKFGRGEAVGIDLMLKGLARMGKSDSEILERGIEAIEALHAVLSKTRQ